MLEISRSTNKRNLRSREIINCNAIRVLTESFCSTVRNFHDYLPFFSLHFARLENEFMQIYSRKDKLKKQFEISLT